MTNNKVNSDIVLELAPFGGVRPPCQPGRCRPLSPEVFQIIEAWARRKFDARGPVQIVEWVSSDSRSTPHRVELTWSEGGNTWGTVLFESTEQLLGRARLDAGARAVAPAI
jgi:hypothetical protein